LSIVTSECLICQSTLRIDAWYEMREGTKENFLRLVDDFNERNEPMLKVFMLCQKCGTSLRKVLKVAIHEHFAGESTDRFSAWAHDTLEEVKVEILDAEPIVDERSACNVCNDSGWTTSSTANVGDSDFGVAVPCKECRPNPRKAEVVN